MVKLYKGDKMEKVDNFLTRYNEILDEQIKINKMINKAEQTIEKLKVQYKSADMKEKSKIEMRLKKIEVDCLKLHDLALENNKRVKELAKDYPTKNKKKK